MQLKKIYYRWRQTRILGKSAYVPSLKMQIGAVAIVTLFSQGQLVNAKNDNNQEKHDQKQAQHAQQQANHQAQQQAHQQQQQNHQAQKQAQQQQAQQQQQQNHQAQKQAQQQQAQNQQAQNQAAHDQARNQQAQYKAAQDQFKNQAAQNADRNRERERQANNQANDREREHANNLANDRERASASNKANERARNEANHRANEREINQANARNNDRDRYRHDQRANNRPGQYKRWDNGLNNRQRYQAYKKYRNNWNEQRVYLRSNMNRFNELARLNQQQQNLIDSQMRAAYLAYNNNNYNGPYNWSNYSNPQFIDYMHSNNPSLLQRILSMLGLGAEDEYLYSSNWSDERSELAQNIANIHQLAMEGRITRSQEQQLLEQLRPEFMEYHNNNYNGSIGWSQYSDPGFVDYLNKRRPSILMTVRDYLVR